MEDREAMANHMEQNSSKYRGVVVEEYHRPQDCRSRCGMPTFAGKPHSGMAVKINNEIEIVYTFDDYLKTIQKNSVWLHFYDLGVLAETRNVHLIIVTKR